MPDSPPTALLDALSEGVILIKAGRVHYLNAAAATFLEVEGTHSSDLPLIAVLRDHRLERAYLQKESLECETRGRILQVSPIPGGLSLIDLTERKRAEETARELLAVLSHELRTPVSTIRSTLEALRSDDLPDKLRTRFLTRAEAESERLVRLLGDLTVDVKPPKYRSVFIPDVVERALGLVSRTLSLHDICLKQDLEPLTVWADEDKLLQILINLLENAAVHGPDHKTVWLRAKLVPETQGFAQLSIQDEGKPLPDETIKHLFEPHTRGQSVKAKGTGLGLYIVKNIAERWGGDAWGRGLERGNEFGVSVRLAPSSPSS